MSDNLKPTSQKRIALWCVGRSMSSVLTRSLSQIPDSYALFEPFTAAVFYGSELRSDNTYRHGSPTSGTCESVKALCEQPWPGKSLVLFKDPGHAMTGKYNMIPEGYQHLFLIRHPSKVIRSHVSAMAAIPENKKDYVNQFRHLYDLHEYVSNTLHLESVVLDADDLVKHAQKTLQTLCQILGLPFSESLLQWDRSDTVPNNWMMPEALWEENQILGWYDKCLRSTGFINLKEEKDKEAKTNELTPEMEKRIGEALPFYEALHKLRISVLDHDLGPIVTGMKEHNVEHL